MFEWMYEVTELITEVSVASVKQESETRVYSQDVVN